MRHKTWLALVAVVLAALLWQWPRHNRSSGESGRQSPAGGSTPVAGANRTPAGRASAVGAFDPQAFPLVARLNAPDATIAQDLDALRQTLEAWRTNFPREGNPVGENAEITAALAGANRLQLVLIPRNHPAVSAGGELCDRWGTPFRFHQLSGEVMEIRSAGPDRRFGTADDVQWSP